jgi:phosphatidate cytidylyltransferase
MMSLSLDPAALRLIAGVIAVLVVATIVGRLIRRRNRDVASILTLNNLNARINAWWVMVAVLALAVLSGRAGSAIFFGIVSFLALREFMSLVPTRPGDHRALVAIFLVITPLQYILVAVRWYGLYSILIPVYAFLFLATRTAVRGDAERFLERTAELQWGLMVCVYCVSYAPALLTLTIPGFRAAGGGLLLFLLVVTEASDVLQYVWGKLIGRRRIAPAISPNKTWGGFLGGIASATAVGAGLWWITPFRPWQAAAMALVITLMGFAGGLTMSAIKRDRGVKDFGNLIAGHGGVLDRIDSLCFAAPVFFHLVRYFFARG